MSFIELAKEKAKKIDAKKAIRTAVVGGLILAGGVKGAEIVNNEVGSLNHRISVLEQSNTLLKSQMKATDAWNATTMKILCETDQADGLLDPSADCDSLVQSFIDARDKMAGELADPNFKPTPEPTPVPQALPGGKSL